MADMKERIKNWLSWYHSWYGNIEITTGLEDRAVDASKIIKDLAAENQRYKEALEKVLIAYKKLDSEIGDSDLDSEQRKNIRLTLGNIRDIQKFFISKSVNVEFFADSDKLPPLEKKLPWGLRPRQG